MTDHQWDGMVEMFIALLLSQIDPDEKRDRLEAILRKLQKNKDKDND